MMEMFWKKIRSFEPILPPLQEEQYRLTYYKSDMKQIIIMMALVLVLSLLWFAKEAFIGHYRFSLLGIYLLRCGYIAAGFCFLIFHRIRKIRVINKKLFMVFAFLLIAHQLAVFLSRPFDYAFTSYSSLLLIFLIYFTFPFHASTRALLAIVFSLTEITMTLFLKHYQSGGAFTVIFVVIAMNIVCLIYSAMKNSSRRDAFRQLSEKEVLLREVNHRIKNNITTIESMLQIQAHAESNSETLSILQDVISRIQSMRVIYDTLMQRPGCHAMPIQLYVDGLLSAVMNIFPNSSKITLVKNIQEFDLDVKRLFPLGTIVNEIITNSMKYGFSARESGTIKIDLIKRDNEILLDILDDGIGFSEPFDAHASGGYGLMLVKMLSEQLKGELVLQNRGGAHCSLRIPV